MPVTRRLRSLSVALFCFIFLVQTPRQTAAIDAKCSACKAIAAELQRKINNEAPRNHVDLRHRLDSQGNRYGKVIEYKASELRAVELLDTLCKRMKDYTIIYTNTTVVPNPKYLWIKYQGEGAFSMDTARRPAKDEEEARGKELETYCGRVLEEYEDEVYEGIMKGGFDTQGVQGILCEQITGVCEPEAAEEAAPAPVPDEEVKVEL